MVEKFLQITCNAFSKKFISKSNEIIQTGMFLLCSPTCYLLLSKGTEVRIHLETCVSECCGLQLQIKDLAGCHEIYTCISKLLKEGKINYENKISFNSL